MTESLFSASWYRVAELRPRLRSHALIHRHRYRGQIWYVLQDRSTGRFHRFSPVANFVIGLMNGTRTLRQIWDLACTRLGDDAPTQDEVINVLASLHRADVLQTDAPPDIGELHERNVKQERLRLKQYIQNPLALRFPLFDPDRLLNWLDPVTRRLFGWGGALLWALVVGWALVLAGAHWNELTEDVTDRVLAAENLLLMGLAFPFAKLVHEFGHGLAVKARGGEVHEMGIMVLILMPLPYVDASASIAFREKHERILVGAAGMLSELFLAALAMFVWLNVEAGLVRALAYNVMIIAGVSTLVFNGNPLLRFDGYYMLSDLLEIPNLGQRANTYLGYVVRRYALGVKSALAPETAPGERSWFIFYAIASFLYRMFVMMSIAVLLAEQYFVLGVLLALWSLYTMLVQPLAKRVTYLFAAQELRGRRMQALTAVTLTALIVVAIIAWVPAPSWTRTEGVAVAPQNAQVRAGTDAFIRTVAAKPNQAVKAGEVLVVTEDPELLARVQLFEAQLREQQARYAAAHEDRVQMNMIREEIAHIEERLESARRRAGELTVRSPGDGTFVMAQTGDAPGRFVHRGELLGYVMDYSRVAVQVVVPQGEVDLVRKMTRRVQLRRVERIPDVLTAQVKRVLPAATSQLPNLALSAQGGGEVSLDPHASGDPGRAAEAKTATPLFIFELELADASRLLSLGSRIYVRFERAPEPLGTQWYRAVRRLLLKRFNV
jgi:putative peptide zinc metalloprotease protein